MQACVRRRAVQSVIANPLCPDAAAAERAVNEVWESCFNDTRPFDEVRLKLVFVVLAGTDNMCEDILEGLPRLE